MLPKGKVSMEKYVCVGSHGAGKTTLSYLLASEYKKQGKNTYLVQERVRLSPFPLNEKMVPETSLWAATSQINEELMALSKNYDTLIADRSPYDTFLYSNYFKLDHPALESLRKAAFKWLQSYKKIFWVRPDVPIQDDGIRSTIPIFQKQMDLLFDQFFETFKEIPKRTIWTSEIFQLSSDPMWLGSLQS